MIRSIDPKCELAQAPMVPVAPLLEINDDDESLEPELVVPAVPVPLELEVVRSVAVQLVMAVNVLPTLSVSEQRNSR